MSYFSTESPENALKDIPHFHGSDFLSILKSEHIASIIERNTATIRSPPALCPNLRLGRAVACPHMIEDTHYRVLKILEQNSQVIQREWGVSLGKANNFLKTLIDKNMVAANNFDISANKSSYFYAPNRGVEAKSNNTVRFLQRKIVKYQALAQK